MCGSNHRPEMAGLTREHLELICQELPDQWPELARDIFGAITEAITPHLPLLPALVAMVESARAGDFGVLQQEKLVRLPLSIIGRDGFRYRTPLVADLHETVLSARMSDLTMSRLRQILHDHHDLDILFYCSCGALMGHRLKVTRFRGSAAHFELDRSRSALDADGSPVVEVESFRDIPVPTEDLAANGAEERLYGRIGELLNAAVTTRSLVTA